VGEHGTNQQNTKNISMAGGQKGMGREGVVEFGGLFEIRRGKVLHMAESTKTA